MYYSLFLCLFQTWEGSGRAQRRSVDVDCGAYGEDSREAKVPLVKETIETNDSPENLNGSVT